MTDPRAGDEPELIDPAAKTQPAEGGRDEVDESLDRRSDDEGEEPVAGG